MPWMVDPSRAPLPKLRRNADGSGGWTNAYYRIDACSGPIRDMGANEDVELHAGSSPANMLRMVTASLASHNSLYLRDPAVWDRIARDVRAVAK